MPLFRKAHDIAHQHGLQIKHHRRMGLGEDVFKINRELKLDAVYKLAKKIVATDPSVEFAEPSGKVYPLASPTDPGYSAQWHYFEAIGGINLPKAWDFTNGSGVVVAVIDT